jgi:putative oxidoreductase
MSRPTVNGHTTPHAAVVDVPASTRRPLPILDWITRLVPAAIMGQTLPFKLTGAPETVWIFSQLGVEPWGRLTTAGFETLALLLLLRPATSGLGGLLTLGLMGGAIMGHLTVLGIEVQGDGGALFALACVSLVCAAVTTWRHRADLPLVGPRLGDQAVD